MKKLVALTLALAFVVVIVSCGGSKTPPASTKPGVSSAQGKIEPMKAPAKAEGTKPAASAEKAAPAAPAGEGAEKGKTEAAFDDFDYSKGGSGSNRPPPG